MPLDPQARKALDILAAMPAVDTRYTGEQIHAAMAAAPPPEGPSSFAAGDGVERIENRLIAGPGGDLKLRLYYPRGTEGALPITLFFHGGGFVFGSPEMHDNICRCLAQRTPSLVVSVDYRLSPEAKYPAAVEDAQAALRWVYEHAASIGGDGKRIAVAGDSAGAALATCLAARAELKLAHQLLLYPVTDCRFDTLSYRVNGTEFFLTEDMMRWFWKQYLADDSAAESASPLRNPRLSMMPPASVHVAEFDPLRDEGMAYAHRLKAAGVSVQLVEWPGQIHGFASMLGVIDAADSAMSESARALAAAFAAS